LDFLTLEDGTDTLGRNVGKGLPLDAAEQPRRAHILSLSPWELEITENLRRIVTGKVLLVAEYYREICSGSACVFGARRGTNIY
jgi:hypothetical protein